jgi:hypothetical protein
MSLSKQENLAIVNRQLKDLDIEEADVLFRLRIATKIKNVENEKRHTETLKVIEAVREEYKQIISEINAE